MHPVKGTVSTLFTNHGHYMLGMLCVSRRFEVGLGVVRPGVSGEEVLASTGDNSQRLPRSVGVWGVPLPRRRSIPAKYPTSLEHEEQY